MPPTPKKLITLVVPVLNEQDNLLPFYEAVAPVLDTCADRYDFELLFTDNHSSDSTFEILKELYARDPRVRAIRFSRNFGYQKSILTGYRNGRGAALIQLDCDLQDPPTLIPVFLSHWEEGYDVVYGVRKTRRDGVVLHATRKIFYRVANFLSEDILPIDAGDFRLVDRKLIDVLRSIHDAHPYLRGMIAAMGFRQVGVPYHRSARERGTSKFRFRDLVNLAVDGILSHSTVPLRLASFFGWLVSGVTVLAIASYVAARVFFGKEWPAGFTTLAVLVLFGIAVNALFLGVIGEYLGRIFQQVKQKPTVIVEAMIGTVSDAPPRPPQTEENELTNREGRP